MCVPIFRCLVHGWFPTMWMNKVLSYYFSCQSLCLLALIPQCRTDMKIVRRSFKNRRAAQKAPITSCCLSRFLSAVTVSEWLPLQLSLVKKLNKICFLEDLDFFFTQSVVWISFVCCEIRRRARAHTYTHTLSLTSVSAFWAPCVEWATSCDWRCQISPF